MRGVLNGPTVLLALNMTIVYLYGARGIFKKV
jgi:hypothetical protein